MFNAVVTCPSASSAGLFSECLEQEMPVQVAWSSVKFNQFPAFAVARVALRVQVGGRLLQTARHPALRLSPALIFNANT